MNYFTETTHEIKGYSIYSRLYSVDDAKANILFLHGYCEHSGMYIQIAKYFTSNNFNFYMIDLPGHGRSSGKRGIISDFNEYVDITFEYIKLIKKSDIFCCEQLPLYCFGFSLGGLIISKLSSSKDSSQFIDGVVCINPTFQINSFWVYFFYYIIIIFISIFPIFPFSLIDENIFNDKHQAKIYFDDTYRVKEIDIYTTMKIIQEGKKEISFREYSPMLLIQSEKDKLIHPKGSIKKSKHFRLPQSKFHLIKNQNHMLLHEDQEYLLTVINEWIMTFID